MEHEHIIHAIVRKHADLTGRLKELNEETARLRDEIAPMCAARCSCSIPTTGSAASSRSERRRANASPRRKLMPAVLDGLREAPAGRTVNDLTRYALGANGDNGADAARGEGRDPLSEPFACGF
jgi:hypothetical protein